MRKITTVQIFADVPARFHVKIESWMNIQVLNTNELLMRD
jgi:hypothetical protein